jgi:hypothetical protein
VAISPRVLFAVLAWSACKPAPVVEPASPPAQAQAAAKRPPVDEKALAEWIAWLADDAQAGRAPGSEADPRVAAFVAERMAQAGLEPAGEQGFMQPFPVTDGVRLRASTESRLGEGAASIAHHLVTFSGDTSGAGPVSARLVFAGHGIAGDGPDSGDYLGILGRVRGSIVVVRAGAPADPHLSPAAVRVQSRLIAARDRGAVGFVLWDPATDVPPPNHGQADDLGIPALFVGTSGTPALLRALGAPGRRPDTLRAGRRGRNEVAMHVPIERVVLSTANVVGRLSGVGAAPREQVVIGAHLDHLGMGTSSSLAPGEVAVHNGADDNASGVATMLALAQAAAAGPRGEQDLLFVAFGAEEMGLLGSKHFVERWPAEERARTIAMLNFDMVGRLRERLIVNGSGSAREWEALLRDVAGGLELSLVEDGYGPSDHSSFYEAGVPVLHFFTGAHEDYHRPGDDVDKTDPAGAARVGELALRVIDRLERRDGALAYVRTERPAAARGGFRVSLGTMPDYAGGADGLRLAGVRPGGPAEQAGLRKGDVIVRIGSRDVHGIDDYMAAFAELEPGREVAFSIVREGQTLEVTVVPAAPAPR